VVSPTRPVPQPRLAYVASAIGDPARAAMLSRLLDGRYHTAAELAAQAGVAASTASQHLKVLADAQLVSVRPQGRHRYFMLSDGDVAHALEALLRVADARTPEIARWERPAMRPLRTARCCYGHVAGSLGVRLHDALLEQGWLEPVEATAQEYGVTLQGVRGLQAWGVDVPAGALASAGKQQRRWLYGCVDWSERRDHFAGLLAVATLEAVVAKDWVRRVPDSRELRITPTGLRHFSAAIGWRPAEV
jgi:DNA-binding transcriptional ArsR family regulator